MVKITKQTVTAACAALVLAFGGGAVFAAPDSEFSQVINGGTLAADIKDENRVTVASPAVAMGAVTTSFDCQYVGNGASTGTFGTNTQRIYVENPGIAVNGWTLNIAATSGTTAEWAGPVDFDFNDPTGTNAGCADGADADSSIGQMTVDPSSGTASVTTDCVSCTTTGITQGSSASFNEGTTDEINLINAAAGSDDVWRGYMEDVLVTQTIPAETPAGTYTIDLTVDAVAQ